MLNFTGQTKKRVINLGDRRQKGKSFLEQTKLQRQQREESRVRDRSATIIQLYVRRRLSLFKASECIKQQWLANPGPDWATWATQFAFVARFGRRAEISDLLPRFRAGLAKSKGDLSTRSVEVLVGSLNGLLDREIAGVTECLCDLVAYYGVHVSTAYSGIIPRLQKHELTQSIVDLIFAVNMADSYEHFVLFLATAQNLEYSQHFASIVRVALAHNNIDVLRELSDCQKITLLVNVLVLQRTFEAQDYLLHTQLLSTMKFSIRATNDDDEDDLVQESQYYEHSELRVVRVSSRSAEIILSLYSSNYISHVIGQFRNGSENSSLALQSIALLMYLFPQSKTKLCMLLTVTAGSHKWFFEELVRQPTYVAFRDAEKTNDFLTSHELQEFFPSHENSIFWNLLYTYEELLSYWLIVSNDMESFSEDSILLENVNDFSHFLKILCLTLIFNSRDTQARLFFGEITKLKDISLALLNQVYIKNLRLKFLPNDFWKLKRLNFDIDGMIQIVLDDEERRVDLDSSEEETRRGSVSIKRNKLRTGDVAAKLEVLSKVSFFVDFKDRVKVFQSLIDFDQQRLNPVLSYFQESPSKLSADIHRDALLFDAYTSFHKSGPNFKNRLSVTFHNEHGVEAGIDGGGITKEFLTSVVMEGFSPESEFRLFKETATDNEIYPNDDIYLQISKRINLPEQQQRLLYMRFLGMVIGKCLYENVLVDIAFAPFFLSKWGNTNYPMKNSVNDLGYLDSELYHNLMKLLGMNESQLASLDLNFTIDEFVDGKTLKYDLLPPNGESVLVNTSNRLNYIHQMANFKLNQCLHIQTKYFLEGLYDVISSTWLNMFDPFEMQMLISGGQSDVNMADWKENVLYGGFYDDDLTVVYFWQVVEEMSPQEKSLLIKFVTSVSRAPLLGFGALSPKFGIRNSGRYPDRLPTASTCVNLLKLPDYQNKTLIREKLVYAINTNSGFDLS